MGAGGAKPRPPPVWRVPGCTGYLADSFVQGTELEGGSAPLWLFSNSTEKSQASQWAVDGHEQDAWVAAHPDAVPGMKHGDVVRVVSDAGELQARLRFDSRQRRDVAIMPKGGHFDRGQSVNALIEARPTDIGLGAAYLDCLVRLAPKR